MNYYAAIDSIWNGARIIKTSIPFIIEAETFANAVDAFKDKTIGMGVVERTHTDEEFTYSVTQPIGQKMFTVTGRMNNVPISMVHATTEAPHA